jgi:hypothetical protein
MQGHSRSHLPIALRSVPRFACSCSRVVGSISTTANCLPSTEPASGSQKQGPQLHPQFAERVHPGRRRAAERLSRAAGSEERRGHDGCGARTKDLEQIATLREKRSHLTRLCRRGLGMAARTKVDVGYNVQIAVDASNRLIVVKDRPRGGRMLGGAKGLLDHPQSFCNRA